MKPLTSILGTIACLCLFSLYTKAQTTPKPRPETIPPPLVNVPGLDSLRKFNRVDSLKTFPDTSKFVRKPNYRNGVQPVEMPNSFKAIKPEEQPMPVHKIPLEKPESKHD